MIIIEKNSKYNKAIVKIARILRRKGLSAAMKQAARYKHLETYKTPHALRFRLNNFKGIKSSKPINRLAVYDIGSILF